MYIWFATQCHNIYNYLDQIEHETQNFIDCSKVLHQEFYMQNPHFLPNKLNKPNFHKNFHVFFSKYFYTNVGNMLLVDDTPCKIIFNGSYIGIFWIFFMTFVSTTIICWELFSLTWNLFIPSNMVFPHLYIIIPLVGLDALVIVMILDNLKCYL